MRRLVFRFAAGLALVEALASCAVIHIQTSGKDDVEVKQGVGIVSVNVKPEAGAVLVDSTSFGAINGFDGFSIGFHSATVAALAGDRCQLVLWIKTEDQLNELNQLLRDQTGVCVLRHVVNREDKP